MRIELLKEPMLIFENNKRCYDPKFGIMLHGPCGTDPTNEGMHKIVRAGVIGTKSSIERLKSLLEVMRNRIDAKQKSKSWKREFPGLGPKSLMRFDVVIPSGYDEAITLLEENEVLAKDSRRARIVAACKIYESKLNDLISSTHPKPDIIFYPLSSRLVERTKDPSLETEKIVYAKRRIAEGERFQEVPLFDFHHFLKVIGFPHKVPSQIITPMTLEMSDKKQDLATIAWNFSVAIYYKATHTPWKLADLDEETCYVGISFFDELTPDGIQKRAAMAHVYLRTGESQIIRGKSFSWEDRRRRSPHLDRSLATEILSDVVSLYKNQKGKEPSRVVVHKSSEYIDEEIDGFSQAVDSNSSLDLVHIFHRSSLRFFLRNNGFPPLRGTMIHGSAQDSAYLYTTGYLPCFSTYMGSGTPWPLEFRCDRLDTEMRLVGNDIMALTRLDWNNTDFCTSQPVTISVSRKVGGILAESRARDVDPPPQSYSYYM